MQSLFSQHSKENLNLEMQSLPCSLRAISLINMKCKFSPFLSLLCILPKFGSCENLPISCWCLKNLLISSPCAPLMLLLESLGFSFSFVIKEIISALDVYESQLQTSGWFVYFLSSPNLSFYFQWKHHFQPLLEALCFQQSALSFLYDIMLKVWLWD